MRSAILSSLAFLCVAGCAPGRPPASVTTDGVVAGGPWASAVEVAHPLVGRIWDVKGMRFVDRSTLVERARGARWIMLGEKHDNTDHHRLQADVLRAMVAGGKAPAVAFEMIDLDRQDELDRAIASAPKDPDAIARGANWAASGWPAWAGYRPIAVVVADAGLRVVAANYPSAAIKSLFSPDHPALDHETELRFALDKPLLPALEQSLEAELTDSHCGMLPKEHLPTMILAQRLRDGAMAERLSAGALDGGVLVAGNGHARIDRGVPWVMQQKGVAGPLVAIAFEEVLKGQSDPAAYARGYHADSLPFDFVWFTPRVDDHDPCAKMRKMHEIHQK